MFPTTTVRVYTTSFEMISIDEGSFLMGAAAGDPDAYDDERPQHEVHLSSYQIGQTQVTQGLYKAVMGTNPSRNPASPQHPVENVSWFDAVRFCNKLSKACGLDAVYTIESGENPSVSCDVNAHGFRLPTEAEWECAAKAGQNFKYSGSNDPDEVAWFEDNSDDETHPVAQKKPNAWGLYDMSGNVREWCWDGYDPEAYANRVRWAQQNAGCVRNPTGKASMDYRVLRGGCFLVVSRRRRVTGRSTGAAARRFRYMGLRVALSSPSM